MSVMRWPVASLNSPRVAVLPNLLRAGTSPVKFRLPRTIDAVHMADAVRHYGQRCPPLRAGRRCQHRPRHGPGSCSAMKAKPLFNAKPLPPFTA